MPDTDRGQAEVAVTRLESLVEKWNAGDKRQYSIQLSYGIAEYESGSTVEDFIKAADADLYAHKAHTATRSDTEPARA